MTPKVKDNFMNNTECFKCGEKFECGVDEIECWCMETESIQSLRTLLIEGQTCLCKKCLEVRIAQYHAQEDDGYCD